LFYDTFSRIVKAERNFPTLADVIENISFWRGVSQTPLPVTRVTGLTSDDQAV
jgi:hypothetical protein